MPVDLVGPVDGYADSLPPLLDLFGYHEPPPPPAWQLVGEAIALLDRADDDGSPAHEVDEARRALGDLLARTLPLVGAEVAPPTWEVARATAEAIPAMEAGAAVAVGATTGTIATVATSLMAGAVTGGLGTLATVLVVGGLRRWRRRRAARAFADELAEHREQLHVGLLPAARGAVLHHLDAVADLLGKPSEAGDPLTAADLSDHLDALLDITRRFALGEQHLTAQTKQASLRGDREPHRLMTLLRELHRVAFDARADLLSAGRIEHELSERLESLTASFALNCNR